MIILILKNFNIYLGKLGIKFKIKRFKNTLLKNNLISLNKLIMLIMQFNYILETILL